MMRNPAVHDGPGRCVRVDGGASNEKAPLGGAVPLLAACRPLPRYGYLSCAFTVVSEQRIAAGSCT